MKKILSIGLLVIIMFSYLNAIDRTIGGKLIQDGDNTQPWLVNIENNGRQMCTASLVSDRFLLTANHCVIFAKLNDLTIKARGSDIESKAKKAYFPADGFKRIIMDFIIIELETPIPLSSYVLLPEANTIDKYYGTEDSSILFGYGINDVISKEEADKQLETKTVQPTKLTLSIMNRATCTSTLIADGAIPDTTEQLICSDAIEDAKRKSKPIGQCSGDSGGPLVVFENNQYTQIGVVSGYLGDGNSDDCGYNTGKYANVSYHYDWIKTIIKGESTATPVAKEDLPLGVTTSADPLVLFYGMLPSMPKQEWNLLGLGVDTTFLQGSNGGYDLDPKILNSNGNGFSLFVYKGGAWIEYEEDTIEPISLVPFQGVWIYLK